MTTIQDFYRITDCETPIKIVSIVFKNTLFKGINGHTPIELFSTVIFDISLKIDDETEQPYILIKV